MANCAVVNSSTNIVENIIVAAPTDTPPAGTFLVPIYTTDINWQWVDANTGFINPNPPAIGA
jgi:hypothetical protein